MNINNLLGRFRRTSVDATAPLSGPEARQQFIALHQKQDSKIARGDVKTFRRLVSAALTFTTPAHALEVVQLAHRINHDPSLRKVFSKKALQQVQQAAENAVYQVHKGIYDTVHELNTLPANTHTFDTELNAFKPDQRPQNMEARVLTAQHHARLVASYGPTQKWRAKANNLLLKLAPDKGIAAANEPYIDRVESIPYPPTPPSPLGDGLPFGKAVLLAKHPSTKEKHYAKHLQTADASYKMGPVAHNGQFGQTRFALKDDGEEKALKVQRTHQKVGPNSPKSVLPRTLEDVTREAHVTASVANHINDYLRSKGYDLDNDSNPFAGVRARLSSVAVETVFIDPKGKVYQVAQAHDGNALALHKQAAVSSPQARADVATSLAAQMFTELEAMHGGPHFLGRIRSGGQAHRDLKLDNMVYNKEGSVKLIDFDTVTPTNRHGLPKETGRVGTTLSPEMLDPKDPQRFGLANDVWAMSASVLEFLQNKDAPTSPFLGAQIGAGQGRKQKATFDAFPTYRRLALETGKTRVEDDAFLAGFKADGGADLNDVQKANILAGKATLQSFFTAAKEANPQVTTLLLRDGMAPSPTNRANAEQLASELRELLPPRGSARAAQVRQVFAKAAETHGTRSDAMRKLRNSIKRAVPLRSRNDNTPT